MDKGTSVQTGLPGFGKEEAQVKMFEECNTATGQEGYKIPITEKPKELPRNLYKNLT